MEMSESKQFREKVRVLERGLNQLHRNTNSCFQTLTLPQWYAMIEIGRKEKVVLKELTQILVLDTSTTSRIVEGLVKKNYVERNISEVDRRSICITLTKEGKELFHQIDQCLNQKYAAVYDDIPVDEKVNVLHALDVMLSTVRSKIESIV